MSEKVTIKVILKKSKKYANGESPLCLKITQNRKRRQKVLKGLTWNPKYWNDNRNEPRRNHPVREKFLQVIRDTQSRYENAQLALISEGKEITPDRIIQKVEKPGTNSTVLEFYGTLMQEPEARGKTRNLRHYMDVKKQLENFLASKNMNDVFFSDIDYRFLTDWETYLRKRGEMDTTLFAYLKNLRTVYNRAIRENIVKESEYPFKNFKLTKFNTSTIKRAISREDIRPIEQSDTTNEYPRISEAQKYALFSYYVFGINLTDMAYLRWEDIDANNVLSYRRQKTGEVITVEIFQEALDIAEYFRPFHPKIPLHFSHYQSCRPQNTIIE